jgi:thioredoxin-related protein
MISCQKPWLGLFLLILIGVQRAVFASGSEIPLAENLAHSAQLAQQQAVPTVVFVSRDACPYCRTLRDSILEPMYAAGKFEGRAVLVEVSLDKPELLTGFDGQLVSAKDWAQMYKAQITPTLLFLDSEGREIGKRRIGISNLEMYGFYLQKSIDEALAHIFNLPASRLSIAE